MNKPEIVQAFKSQLRGQYQRAVAAIQEAAEGATGDDTRAESKYDTRGLESSYLAAGQVEQADRLFRELSAVEACDFSEPRTEIGAGCLVEGERDGSSQFYLISPGGGGVTVESGDGLAVTAIGISAPLAQQLIGRKAGESLEEPPLRIVRVW